MTQIPKNRRLRPIIKSTLLVLALGSIGLDIQAAEPHLRVAGVCPGVMGVTVSNVEPNGRVAFVKASSRGSDTIPAGRCVGTELDLANAGLVTVFAADADGRIDVSPTLSESNCDQFLQVVDVTSCAVSNVAQLAAVQVLAVTGDLIDVGTEGPIGITTISAIDVNSSGEWMVTADTDAVGPQTSEVVLKNGSLLLREGDLLVDPDPLPGFSDRIDRFDSVTLNEESRSAFTFCVDGPDGIPDDDCVGTFELDSTVFLDSELAAAEGQMSGPFVYGTILEAKINKDEDILVAAALDPPSPERALVLIDDIDAPADQVIVRVGDPLAERTVENLRVGPHTYGFNDLDQALYIANLTGPPSGDSVIFLEPENAVVAREGDVAPPPNSKPYDDLFVGNSTRVDLNSAGSAAFVAPVVGPCCESAVAAPLELTTIGCTPEPADAVLVYDFDPTLAGNETQLAEIGDEFPLGSGNTICGFGLPVYVDEFDSVIYSIKWNDPDDCPGALVRHDGVAATVLLEAGDIVVVDGVDAEIANLCGDSIVDEMRCYDVSPSGELVGVYVTLTDGREVALMLAI